MRPLRLVVWLILFLALTGFRVSGGEKYGGLGTPAPDARLVSLEGLPRALSEAAGGGWTLLKFATTWCPQCEKEAGEMNILAPWLIRKKVKVVEVFIREEAHVVRNALKKMPRSYRGEELLDLDGVTLPLYGVRVIPRLLLVDPGGMVRMDSRFQPADALRDAIREGMKPR